MSISDEAKDAEFKRLFDLLSTEEQNKVGMYELGISKCVNPACKQWHIVDHIRFIRRHCDVDKELEDLKLQITKLQGQVTGLKMAMLSKFKKPAAMIDLETKKFTVLGSGPFTLDNPDRGDKEFDSLEEALAYSWELAEKHGKSQEDEVHTGKPSKEPKEKE